MLPTWYPSSGAFRFFILIKLGANRYHDLPKRTETNRNVPERTATDRNGPTKIPKRTFMGMETDRNGSRTSVGTEMDRNRLQLIPKRTGRKSRVGYDRNNPKKCMYVLVCMYWYACMYICMYVCI